jgi:hypothetical protein
MSDMTKRRRIAEEAAAAVPSYFETLGSKSLTLTHYLAPSTIIRLIKRARRCTAIDTLGIHNVRITDTIARELVQLIASRQWKKITFSWCRGEIGSLSQAAILHTESLVFVAHCEVYCPFTVVFLLALKANLRSTKVLRRLKLQYCQITASSSSTQRHRQEGSTSNAISLGQSFGLNSSLEELELAQCRCNDEAGFAQLVSGIEHHTRLRSIVIRDCIFTSDNFAKLCHAIKQSPSLQSASLSMVESDQCTVNAIANLASSSGHVSNLSLRLLPVDVDLSTIVGALAMRTVPLDTLNIYSLTEERLDVLESFFLRHTGTHIRLHGGTPLHPWRQMESLQKLLKVVQANRYMEHVTICIDPEEHEMIELISQIAFYTLWNRSGVRSILEQFDPPPMGLWPNIIHHINHHHHHDIRGKPTNAEKRQQHLNILYYLLQQEPTICHWSSLEQLPRKEGSASTSSDDTTIR